MSATTYPGGGAKKSAELVAIPLTVATLMRPEVLNGGTITDRLVATALVTRANDPAMVVWSLVTTVSKFVPLTVTLLPAAARAGVKLVMVGAIALWTVKLALLVAVLPPTVTLIVPLVAPLGTVVTISVVVDADTVAVTPLNLTMLELGVVLKAVPYTRTAAPTDPACGANSITESVVATWRLIAVMFPTASYAHLAESVGVTAARSRPFWS